MSQHKRSVSPTEGRPDRRSWNRDSHSNRKCGESGDSDENLCMGDR